MISKEKAQEILDEFGVDRWDYRIDGISRENATTLRHLSNGKWAVFFTERGKPENMRTFDSEHRACVELLYDLLRDIEG